MVGWCAQVTKNLTRPKKISFSNKDSGRYYVHEQRIHIPHRDRTSTDRFEMVLLHETAHHIHRMKVVARKNKTGLLFKSRRKATSPVAPHGNQFRRILWKSIEHYYGDPTQYAWHWEYVGVRNWAKNK